MKEMDIKVASRPLSDYVRELGEEMLVLTSNNKPVAAMISLKNVDRESLALSTHPDFLKIIEKSREEIKAGKTLSLEEMRQAVAKMDVRE